MDGTFSSEVLKHLWESGLLQRLSPLVSHQVNVLQVLPESVQKNLRLVHNFQMVPPLILWSVCILSNEHNDESFWFHLHMVIDHTAPTETFLFKGMQILVVEIGGQKRGDVICKCDTDIISSPFTIVLEVLA